MLIIEKVVAGYENLEVLHNISAQMKEKEITCIIGPNGSGKSTLLKTIVGLIKAKQGKIIFNEKNITLLRPYDILREGISMVPQGRSIFPYMTVLENLRLGAYIIRDSAIMKERLDEVFNEFPRLREKRNQMAYTLSGGEQNMLCFGRALMLQPKFILLDEPSIGLAPKIVEAAYEKIEQLRNGGITFAIVEQDVRKALSVADYVYVLSDGQNRYEGPPKDISHSELTKIFLGRVS